MFFDIVNGFLIREFTQFSLWLFLLILIAEVFASALKQRLG